jgi:DsbC/DsbD-like thiol-disulfide interchange protein
MEPGWHIYSSVPSASPSTVTNVRLTLPAGVKAIGEWSRPVGQPSRKDPRAMVYEGSVTFERQLRSAVSTRDLTIGVEVEYQVCNQRFCLPAKKVKQSVSLASTK